MRTLTLQVDEAVSEQFLWLLKHFSPDEVSILDSDISLSDDAYLRSIEGMAQSLHSARNEPNQQAVSLQNFDW